MSARKPEKDHSIIPTWDPDGGHNQHPSPNATSKNLCLQNTATKNSFGITQFDPSSHYRLTMEACVHFDSSTVARQVKHTFNNFNAVYWFTRSDWVGFSVVSTALQACLDLRHVQHPKEDFVEIPFCFTSQVAKRCFRHAPLCNDSVLASTYMYTYTHVLCSHTKKQTSSGIPPLKQKNTIALVFFVNTDVTLQILIQLLPNVSQYSIARSTITTPKS